MPNGRNQPSQRKGWERRSCHTQGTLTPFNTKTCMYLTLVSSCNHRVRTWSSVTSGILKTLNYFTRRLNWQVSELWDRGARVPKFSIYQKEIHEISVIRTASKRPSPIWKHQISIPLVLSCIIGKRTYQENGSGRLEGWKMTSSVHVSPQQKEPPTEPRLFPRGVIMTRKKLA